MNVQFISIDSIQMANAQSWYVFIKPMVTISNKVAHSCLQPSRLSIRRVNAIKIENARIWQCDIVNVVGRTNWINPNKRANMKRESNEITLEIVSSSAYW